MVSAFLEIELDEQLDSPHMSESVEGSVYAVESRESAALVAAAGVGKTSVLRGVRAAVLESRYAVHSVKVTRW